MHILGECEVGSEVGSCPAQIRDVMLPVLGGQLLKQRDPRPVGMGRTMQTQEGSKEAGAEVAVIGGCRQQRR